MRHSLCSRFGVAIAIVSAVTLLSIQSCEAASGTTAHSAETTETAESLAAREVEHKRVLLQRQHELLAQSERLFDNPYGLHRYYAQGISAARSAALSTEHQTLSLAPCLGVEVCWELKVDMPFQPCPRFWHTAVMMDDIGMVVFGGTSLARRDYRPMFLAFNDLWVFDVVSVSWSMKYDYTVLPGTKPCDPYSPRLQQARASSASGVDAAKEIKPPQRALHTAVALDLPAKSTIDQKSKQIMVVYAGFGTSTQFKPGLIENRTPLDDVWVLEPVASTQSRRSSFHEDFSYIWYNVSLDWPAEVALSNRSRHGHSAISYKGAMYVFGGFAGAFSDTVLNDLLKLEIVQVHDPSQPQNHGYKGTWSIITANKAPPARGTGLSTSCGGLWVIAGGSTAQYVLYNDTWIAHLNELDSASFSWEQLTGALPEPRTGAAVTCLPRTNGNPDRVIAFGGVTTPEAVSVSRAYEEDLYPANTHSVIALTGTGDWETIMSDEYSSVNLGSKLPIPRRGATLVTTNLTNETSALIALGGLDTFSMSLADDFWTLYPDSKLWVPLDTLQRAPILAGHAVIHMSNATMLVFGGWSSVHHKHMAMWSHDSTVGVWQYVHRDPDDFAPPHRALFAHGRVNRTTIVMFGGVYNNVSGLWQYFNDMALFTFGPGGTGWIDIPRALEGWPSARGAMAFASAENNGLFIHGGMIEDGTPMDDIYFFDYGDTEWHELAVKPGTRKPKARWGHVMAIFEAPRLQLYIYGGRNKETILSDMWAYDVEDETWKQIPFCIHVSATVSPILTAQAPQTFCPDPKDPDWHTKKTPVQKPGFVMATASQLPGNKKLLMFGGSNSIKPINDTRTDQPAPLTSADQLNAQQTLWEFDVHNNTWNLIVTNTENRPRIQAAMSVVDDQDPSSSVQVFLHGGADEHFSYMALTMGADVGCNAGSNSTDFSRLSCQPCRQGYYVAVAGKAFCASSCPTGTTTNITGASSDKDCNVCVPGWCNGHGSCSVSSSQEAVCSCDFGFVNSRCSSFWPLAVAVVLIVAAVILGVSWTAIIRCFRRVSRQRDQAYRQFVEKELEVQEIVQTWMIQPEDVQLIRRIDVGAEGSFAEVWLGIWCNEQVAVKRMKAAAKAMSIINTSITSDFENEIQSLRSIRHRNLVLFYGAGDWDGRPFLINEYCERGALVTILASDLDLSFELKLRLALDAARGMRFLHARSPAQIHRDLKSANLLVTRDWVCKVADLGTSRILSELSEVTLSLAPSLASADYGNAFRQHANMTTLVGTLPWMGPEVMREDGNYGIACDVYSFGIVLWELATRQYPYENVDLRNSRQLMDYVLSGNRPTPMPTPAQASPEYIALMTRCWATNPEDRPTFAQITDRLDQLHQLHDESS